MIATGSETTVPAAAPPAATRRSTGFYAPELDGLRCLAVLAVMVSHFSWTLGNYFDWGPPGVRLFFVLSGFLITHVLWRARRRCEGTAETRGGALRSFYIRRIFRLWPLYFASLALAYAFAVDGTQASFAWHGFFATNQYVFQRQDWPQLLSHYWTLAVEQQFYVIWPFVVLWLPRGSFRWVLATMIVMGPLFRGLPLALGLSRPEYAGVLLPGCLDFFAFGAVVALAWNAGELARLGSRRILRCALVATATWLLLGAVLTTVHRKPDYWLVYDGLLQGLGFTAVVVYLLRFPGGRLGAFCRWAPFVFLGQISYGLYILHNYAHRFGPSVLRRLTGRPYASFELAHIAFYIALTIIAAVISFYAFEEPLRRLGQRLAAPGARGTPT